MASVLLLLCVLAPNASSQESADDPPRQPVVEGQVYDHNGAGVVDVEVRLLETDPSKHRKPLAVSRTDGFGDFRITHDKTLVGEFDIEFTKTGRTTETRRIEIVAGQPPPFVDLLMSGSLTGTGRVVNERDGSGIASARVHVEFGGREWSVETTAAGDFVIEKMLPGPGTITVDADGFARLRTEVPSAENAAPWQLKMGPARDCRIAVNDWQGKPIKGVLVEGVDDYLQDRWNDTTGDDGIAVIRGLSPMAKLLRVRLSHPQYVSDARVDRELKLVGVPADGVHILSLLSAGNIAGKIIDRVRDRPLHGARIAVGSELNVATLRAWADFDGAFAVGGVTPGDTSVTVYLRGYAPQLKTVTVNPGESTTVDFSLERSQQAKGIVVNEEGAPLPGAYLFATSWRGQRTLAVQAITDGEGRFLLETVPDDSFEVSVQAAGYDLLEGQVIHAGKNDHRFVLIADGRAGAQVVAPVNGDLFPELELVTTRSKTIKTADLKGKTVLIDFWATWCGPCVVELRTMSDIYKEFGDRKDFVMINISVDDNSAEKKIKKLFRKFNMDWPQVFGSKSGAQQASDACGIQFLPTKFLIGPDGKILSIDRTVTTLRKTLLKYLPKAEGPKPPKDD